MSGPEHYAEAERLIAFWEEDPNGDAEESRQCLNAAQAHATLAVAAALLSKAAIADDEIEAVCAAGATIARYRPESTP